MSKEKSTYSNSTHSEKRVAPRYQVALHIHLIFDNLEELRHAYSRDISEGGIFIATESPLPVGSIVRLQISLVHEDIIYIDVKGEVVHAVKTGNAETFGMGVKFIEIDDDSRKFLKDYVMEKKKAGSKPKKDTDEGKKAKCSGVKKAVSESKAKSARQTKKKS